MKSDIFLSLCDDHNSIIHEFGCDISCPKTASICLRGCSQYDHKQKSTKHEFIPARQLYSIVGQIREQYATFQNDFKEVYLKNYLKRIKTAIEEFEVEIVGKFCEEHKLSEFFGRNSDENIQGLLDEKEEDIQYAEFKCKEVFALRHFSNNLYRDYKEDQERRVDKILTKLFEDHLRSHRLLIQTPKPQPDKTQKRQLVFQGFQLPELGDSIQKKLDSLSAEECKSFNEIVFKLKDNFNDYKGSCDFGKHVQSFDLIRREVIKKVAPSQLTVAMRGQITVMPFWGCFLDPENESVSNVRLICTNKSPLIDIQEIRANASSKKIQLHIQVKDWEKHPQILGDQN